MGIFDYIERYKFAIMGTVLFHIGIFIYANFTTIHRPFDVTEPITEIEIPLDDIDFPPDMEKILDLTKTKEISEEVTNIAADANDNREHSYENFSTQELDEQVAADAKALEKQYFDEWAATHPGEETSNFDLEEEKEKENKNNIDKNSIKTDGNNAVAGSVSAMFDLINRKSNALPKPAYLCDRSGTIVIEIKVDQSGKVKSTSFLSDQSVGATQCMINQALKYAKRARFNYSSSAPSTQTGSITYKFVKK